MAADPLCANLPHDDQRSASASGPLGVNRWYRELEICYMSLTNQHHCVHHPFRQGASQTPSLPPLLTELAYSAVIYFSAAVDCVSAEKQHIVAKYANFSNNGDREMKFGLPDGRKHGEYNAVVVVVISFCYSYPT